ncbi:MAG: hypothetical protein ACXW6V_23175 [Candidatus Binatia bacterium]
MSRAYLCACRAPSAIVFAAFLTKLAKHLALLVCLAIAGQATGRVALGQRSILLLVVAAALIHGLGQTLKRRSSRNGRVAS